MSQNIKEPIYLKDYRPPSHWVRQTNLKFELSADRTVVHGTLQIEKNTKSSEHLLRLKGENLKLVSIQINGVDVPDDAYNLTDKELVLHETPQHFSLHIVNEIYPSTNKAFEGLYQSGPMLCTQNEPEGFRRIIYYPDRPDVMSVYTTEIVADEKEFPVLLANGNLVDKGKLDGGRHWVKWEDPFPKPSYLFALVAGDLDVLKDSYTTKSGKIIDLRIYCEHGFVKQCPHAMYALKESMRWDEEVYGLECDLDTYMIVATHTFNMGAMENKGLNIFNASYVLANPETATDTDYMGVERVIAHEYFHNWTGNRVTCREWFQLTLKEGLTVFRDQEFMCDLRSRDVRRIEDVRRLRNYQFTEDQGPLSHPIQPKSYIQINNFYTSTVYEKGAEVIRMIHYLIGNDAFQKGMQVYFDRHDGQAVTTEEFIQSMEKGSGVDLSQFRNWYDQNGTPTVTVSESYDAGSQKLEVIINQDNPFTQSKDPLHMPFQIALFDSNGNPLVPTNKDSHIQHLELKEKEQTFIFEGVVSEPTLSCNRQFTAPVLVERKLTDEKRSLLMGHDDDSFARWDIGQQFAVDTVMELMNQLRDSQPFAVNPRFTKAYGLLLQDESIDPAYKALALEIPSEADFFEKEAIIDFDAIHLARETLLQHLSMQFFDQFKDLYAKMHSLEEYTTDSESIAKRTLKNICLKMMSKREDEFVISCCLEQFKRSNNMTDRLAALACLNQIDAPEREEAMQLFYDQWKDNQLVMAKWLALQATSRVGNPLQRVQELIESPVFSYDVPNLIRALIGSFQRNHIYFHENTGQGYDFMADQVISIDASNPHIAAALAGFTKRYDKMDSLRKKTMRRAIEKILETEGLSSNTYEIVSKSYLGSQKVLT